jgi:CRISPR/Cas system-associated endonuclease Cas1
MGLRLSVERGALVVTDGIADHCRTRRFDKATHGLRRVVIMGTTGTVSIDALHWCSRLGIGVIVLAHDGTAQLASTPRLTDDARLRRTQALAAGEPYGLDVARWLISRKLVGQGSLVLRRLGDNPTAEIIGDLALGVEEATTIDEIRQLEASAAALTSAPGPAGPSARRASRPRTEAVSRHTGHATKGAAQCSRRRCRTGRLSGR